MEGGGSSCEAGQEEESRSKKAGAVNAVRLLLPAVHMVAAAPRAPPLPPPALWTWSRYFRCNYSMDAGEEGAWCHQCSEGKPPVKKQRELSLRRHTEKGNQQTSWIKSRSVFSFTRVSLACCCAAPTNNCTLTN